MVLKNHIAYRFLTDVTLPMEMIETLHPVEFRKMLKSLEPGEDEYFDNKISTLFQFIGSDEQKAYYITNTVLEQFDHLKIKKIKDEMGEHYDWTYFKNLKNQKVTFIFPNNSLLRFVIDDDILHFCQLNYTKIQGDNGNLGWVMFYVNRLTGEQCDHFNHIDVKTIELFIYSLLCFFYLSDNEFVELAPGAKSGTRRDGKFINSFDKIPVTIVNSKWNITSIRIEGFTVCGHFATRWTGEGRVIPKLVFIEPFKKNGYVRKAKKLEEL